MLLVLLVCVSCGGTGGQTESTAPAPAAVTTLAATTLAAPETTEYDPRSATAADRFAKFNELIHLYGSVGAMTEAEALSVAGNYCDNTVDDMTFFLNALLSINTLGHALAEAAAMADAYCPQERVVVEGAMSELGITEPLPSSG